jgi:hypothetical protein
MPQRIVRVDISPLTLLAILERADQALGSGDVLVGRQLVDSAIRGLSYAKVQQDTVLDEAARTPEALGTTLDLTP